MSKKSLAPRKKSLKKSNSTYSIEELEQTFRIHHIRSEKLNIDLIKKFKENNPGKPVPDPFNDDFSLPLALSAICSEILKLKNPCEHE